jgi:hypothetical protein
MLLLLVGLAAYIAWPMIKKALDKAGIKLPVFLGGGTAEDPLVSHFVNLRAIAAKALTPAARKAFNVLIDETFHLPEQDSTPPQV